MFTLFYSLHLTIFPIIAFNSGIEELWMNIEKMRFSFNPKEAFNKLQMITKYGCFEKRDGSIISKVKEGEMTISAPDEVNTLLKNSLRN